MTKLKKMPRWLIWGYYLTMFGLIGYGWYHYVLAPILLACCMLCFLVGAMWVTEAMYMHWRGSAQRMNSIDNLDLIWTVITTDPEESKDSMPPQR